MADKESKTGGASGFNLGDAIKDSLLASSKAIKSEFQNRNVQTAIDMPRIKGLLEDMTLETVASKLSDKYSPNNVMPADEDDVSGIDDIMGEKRF